MTSPITIPEIITAITPDLVANQPPIKIAQVEHLLIHAIHARQVIAVGRAILSLDKQWVMPEGRFLAQMAVATCETTINDNASEQQRMMTLLNEAGVPVFAESDQTKNVATRIHRLELIVEPKDVAKALSVTKEDGYLPGDLWYGGALQSVLRTRSNFALIKTDETTTRLNLRWRAVALVFPTGRC